MTTQLTPAQLEKIVDTLPTTGNGDWSVRQKVVSRHDATGTSTHVSEVTILGPGDKHVGNWVSDHVFRPHGSCSYWYIVQMEDAGWQCTEDMIGRTDEAS